MPQEEIQTRTINERTNDRFNVALPAIAIDSKRKYHIPCIIRDGSITGCRIISSDIDDLPDDIYLKVPDLEEIIKGHVVWRNDRAAGIQFNWAATPKNCKRGASRREVDLPASLLDLNFNYLADCTIRNASRTGCRITTRDAASLPHEFRIRISGLTEPVMVRVVWRKDDTAGLEFFWDSEIYTLDDSVEH